MVDGDHLTRPDGVLRAVAVLQDDQAVARVHLHLRLTSVVHVQDIRLLDRNVPVRQVVTLEHTGAFVDLQLDLWRLVQRHVLHPPNLDLTSSPKGPREGLEVVELLLGLPHAQLLLRALHGVGRELGDCSVELLVRASLALR